MTQPRGDRPPSHKQPNFKESRRFRLGPVGIPCSLSQRLTSPSAHGSSLTLFSPRFIYKSRSLRTSSNSRLILLITLRWCSHKSRRSPPCPEGTRASPSACSSRTSSIGFSLCKYRTLYTEPYGIIEININPKFQRRRSNRLWLPPRRAKSHALLSRQRGLLVPIHRG